MISGLSARIRRDASRILRSGLLNTAIVTVVYEKPVAGSDPIDPAIESKSLTPLASVSDGTRAYTWRAGTEQYVQVDHEITDAAVWYMSTLVAPSEGVNESVGIINRVGGETAGSWTCERVEGEWQVTQIANVGDAVPPAFPFGFEFFDALPIPLPTTTVKRKHPAFVHFVEPVKSGYRSFTEIETGDVILDFLDDVNLPRTGAKFIVDGETYVQKEVGNQLSLYWDLIIEGQRHFRTVVGTKAPGSRTS
jgi:hypothetical protein